MKNERKTLRYVLTMMGMIAASSLVCFVPMIMFPDMSPVRGIALLLCFWIICGALIFYAGRRFTNSIVKRIDKAYQSEKAFISNASHELNNPLTAIQGECEISLMKVRSADDYQASLHRIARETNRIIQLMKHLMFLSKGESEIIKAESEPIILAEFLLQHFNGNRLRFYTDNFSLIIVTSPDLLKTALENIIGNALKYSGDKLVEIQLRGALLEIRDRGMGIPAEELERVFQPFYRASNTREYAGNGIGLSLSIRILNAYGAEVSISSELNEGTKVLIDFQDVR